MFRHGLALPLAGRRPTDGIFPRFQNTGERRVREKDSGAAVKLATVKERLGEKVLVELLVLEQRFFRVWVRRKGRLGLSGEGSIGLWVVGGIGYGVEKL